MKLDLSSLKKAVESLDRAINAATGDKAANLDDAQKETIRAGVIQNFEFTYESCWKFMKRWLQYNINAKIFDGMNRKELFRYAVENRLIDNFDSWAKYHEARNQTAHTYDNKTAEAVFASAQLFLKDAKKFLMVLESKND